MNENQKISSGAIIVGFMLVMILQATLSTQVNAQGCGTGYPRGGAQGGAYASGGSAKYVPTVIPQNVVVVRKWNMVSTPSVSPSHAWLRWTLFPTAFSRMYGYSGYGYAYYDTVIPGKGYWLKFASPETISADGYKLSAVAVPVAQGWNMIGSLSVPIPVSCITSDPPGLIASELYGYDHRYTTWDTVIPGKGYWLKVNNDGTLILSAGYSSEMLAKNAINIVHTDELPPSPPGETAEDVGIPKEYALEQAYPNPFNPTTTIKYQLPVDSKVSLNVYDLLGRVVMVLVDETQTAGYLAVDWNASAFASGVYFYKLEATSVTDPSRTFTDVKKVILMK